MGIKDLVISRHQTYISESKKKKKKFIYKGPTLDKRLCFEN